MMLAACIASELNVPIDRVEKATPREFARWAIAVVGMRTESEAQFAEVAEEMLSGADHSDRRKARSAAGIWLRDNMGG